MKKQKPTSAETGMHKGSSPKIFKNARELRGRMTKAELLLWEELRGKKLGYKFRRQHPIGNYIADFYCHQIHLIIELDGGYHLAEKQQCFDNQRARDLELTGMKVIRFMNEEVISDMKKVLEAINEVIAHATPSP